jgi:hypothetical protein
MVACEQRLVLGVIGREQLRILPMQPGRQRQPNLGCVMRLSRQFFAGSRLFRG